MVLTVSDKVKDAKAGSVSADAEAQWDTESTVAMLPSERRRKSTIRCCIALPWVLLFISFLLMGMVASWGWREHFKLQDVLEQQKENDLNLPIDQVLIPYGNDAIEVPDDRIPYGNDALEPETEPIPYGDDAIFEEGPPPEYENIKINEEVIEINDIENPSETETKGDGVTTDGSKKSTTPEQVQDPGSFVNRFFIRIFALSEDSIHAIFGLTLPGPLKFPDGQPPLIPACNETTEATGTETTNIQAISTTDEIVNDVSE